MTSAGKIRRIWVSWSSGKDSTFALRVAQRDPALEVTGLLVTVNAEADRVAMHAVRRELVEAQAQRLDLPLHVVDLPYPCPNDEYERRMASALEVAAAAGVTGVVFGDLHLADVRAYRESAMAGTGIEPLFPLWGRPTDDLAREMVDAGMRAVLTCVDPSQLPRDFVGRDFDSSLLADLPADVDPCGENGEFHTFVWDAPVFRDPVDVRVGEIVEREGFVFCDVVPTAASAPL